MSASSRCEMLRLAARESSSRPTPSATLPSTRKPCSDSRRAPRCRSCSCRTSSGISRSSACAGGFGMGRRLLQPERRARRRVGRRRRSAARACGRARDRAHRRRPPLPRNRRASASRGMSISAPIVFRPSRSSVRTVSGVEAQGGHGSGASCSTSPSPLGRGRRREGCGDGEPTSPLAAALPRGRARQRPCRRCRRRDRHARRQPKRRKPPLHIARPARPRRRTDARLR